MFDKALFKLRGIKKIMLLLAITAFVQGVFIIVQGYLLARVITNLFHGEELSLQLLPIAVFFVVLVGKQVVILIRDRFILHFSIQAAASLRQQLHTKLFQLGPNIATTEGTGNIVTLALEGISQFETYCKLFLPKFFNMLIIPVLVFAVTLYYDGRSALVLLLVLPTLLFFMVILGYAARYKADKQFASYQVLSNHFVDSLRGLGTLKNLGLSKRYDRNIREVSERYRKSTMSTLSFAFLSTFALEFFSSISVAIVALFLGLGLIKGSIILFPALFILILAPEYFAPIRDFGNDYHATLNGKNAFLAIQRLIDLPVVTVPTIPLRSWGHHSHIALCNVTVQHSDSSKAVLEEICFTWNGVGKIGIIGASGSGKSTLINMLAGFIHPSAGDIVLDGLSTRSFHQTDWLNQILYIPQHPYIFNDTLERNITFYTPHATKEAIDRAIQLSGLTEVVKELPNGLQEVIGESGRLLSGGQEQRIALARAFLDAERRILLFDEPTAHLDIETEWELKQQMLPLFEDRLVFFATHRLHWMTEMDVVIVLDRGKIVETGTPAALLQSKGAYYQLVQAQLYGKEVSE